MESKWYTIKVQSNREKSILERLRTEAARDVVELVSIIPTERVFFSRDGKKAHRDKITYPGYIFIESDNLGYLQELLKKVPGTSGVLKDKSGNISLLRKSEVDKMMADSLKPEVNIDLNTFVIGEKVMIIGGPFDKFKGSIDELNKEKGKVKVSVSIFGRITPVDLQYDQIEKIIN